jgi:plasmid stability protein
MKWRRLIVMLPVELHRQLKIRAAEADMSMAAMIRSSLRREFVQAEEVAARPTRGRSKVTKRRSS